MTASSVQSAPLATRPSGRTAQRKASFVAAFAECGSVLTAADTAGIGRRTHYHWLETDAEYAADYHAACEAATDVLEAEARRRAMAGSDALLMFLLRGLRPDRYRDRATLDHHVTAPPVKVLLGVSLDEV